MIKNLSTIALKYAQAFFNIHATKIDQSILDKLNTIISLINRNKKLMAYLEVPSVTAHIKKAMLTDVSHKLLLDESITTLMSVLYSHGRISLLKEVLVGIIMLYEQHNNIVSCQISTSHPIDQKAEQTIVAFTHTLCPGKKIIPEFIIDKKLIGGLRIRTKSLLWERSIAKRHAALKHAVLQEFNHD